MSVTAPPPRGPNTLIPGQGPGSAKAGWDGGAGSTRRGAGPPGLQFRLGLSMPQFSALQDRADNAWFTGRCQVG